MGCLSPARNSKHLSSVQESEGCERIESRICALPDDLLLLILYHVQTKDGVATSILSKRWRYVWTMLPKLEFKDDGSESVGWFTEKSLQFHKALKLERLTVQLGPRCPVDVDVGKWVENAVNRGVEELDFKLLWTAQPTSFPKSLYTCDTLVDLQLSNQILVDVSFPARLPSLLYLTLLEVVYKDEDSLVKLLSSSPVLEWLIVQRQKDDNLKNFSVKVSSLKTLVYMAYCEKKVDDDEVEEEEVDDDLIRSLIINSPALKDLSLLCIGEHFCLIENMPCLDEANISFVYNPCDKFLSSLSSVKHLQLYLTTSMVACCDAINFSQLVEFYFRPNDFVDWLEPLILLLQNSPKLKSLTINTEFGCLQPSWNQPSCIPGCLSSHLEIFGWIGYGGREDEKQLLQYVLAKSKYLKTIDISFITTCNPEERQKEIESMFRISTSSRLLFPI